MSRNYVKQNGEKGNSTMKIKWFIATFRDMTTNKWRAVYIQADSLREARYIALTYYKGTFETLERIEEK